MDLAYGGGYGKLIRLDNRDDQVTGISPGLVITGPRTY